METNYLEASPGNKSNSRRIAWIAFWAGLIFAQEIMIVGLIAYFKSPETKSLMEIVGAGGTIFGSIAGSAMLFAFGQKSQEPKITPNEPV